MLTYRFPKIRLWLCIMLAGALVAFPALAQSGVTFDIDNCNSGGATLDAGQFTQKVVNCLESKIVESIYGMLQALSDYMMPTVSIMFVLATVIFGIRIIGGERNLRAKATSFLIRMGLVWAFSYNLGGFSTAIFDIMHNMICVVSFTGGGCYSPWGQIDSFMGRLLGFGTTISIVSGLLGILSSAVFSSDMGFVFFLIGTMAVLDILFFIIRIVFTYLSAVVIIGFLIVISPLIIPLAIFNSTEIYFKRWIDTLMAGMLTPILLFAFLQLFLGIFDKVVNDKILAMFSCDNTSAAKACDFRAYSKTNEPLFSWMLPADSNFTRAIEATTKAVKPSTPIAQSNIDPTLRRAQNLGVSTPAINFGPADAVIWQQLIYGVLLLWLYTTLMKSMIINIPQVANNIAGAVSGAMVQASSFEPMVKNTLAKVKNRFAPGGGR